MNSLLSDSGAIRVDIRIDYGETFLRYITIRENGVLKNMTYYDAELAIYYKHMDKLLEVFNNDNGKLQYISTGRYYIAELLTIKSGTYQYYFKTIDSLGIIRHLFAGNFIYE